MLHNGRHTTYFILTNNCIQLHSQIHSLPQKLRLIQKKNVPMYSNDTSNDEVIPIPQPIQPTNQEIEPIIHRKADYTFQSHSRGVSKHSAFSFVSNFSSLNRKNLRRCGRSKASFMLMNAFVSRIPGIHSSLLTLNHY